MNQDDAATSWNLLIPRAQHLDFCKTFETIWAGGLSGYGISLIGFGLKIILVLTLKFPLTARVSTFAFPLVTHLSLCLAKEHLKPNDILGMFTKTAVCRCTSSGGRLYIALDKHHAESVAHEQLPNGRYSMRTDAARSPQNCIATATHFQKLETNKIHAHANCD